MQNEALADWRQFISDNVKLFCQYLETMGAEYFGPDYWLTRNGHGVGFWDRGLDDLGDRLTERAESEGEKHVFINDDNLLEFY